MDRRLECQHTDIDRKPRISDATPEEIARSLVRSANKKRDGKLREDKRGDKRKRRLGGR